MKSTINALNYIEIYYQYNEVHYKYIQMHWKKIQILWCILKHIHLSLRLHSYVLTPKIPWDQKLVDCYLGSLYEEFWFLFNFSFWMSELHISQVFREHQARPIPTPYEPVANFCWKQVLSSMFPYLWKSSYMMPCG